MRYWRPALAILALAGISLAIGAAVKDYNTPKTYSIKWRGEPVFLKHVPERP